MAIVLCVIKNKKLLITYLKTVNWLLIFGQLLILIVSPLSMQILRILIEWKIYGLRRVGIGKSLQSPRENL